MKQATRLTVTVIALAVMCSSGTSLAADPPAAAPAATAKGQWVAISDGVIAQLERDGKKIGYPGLTAGIAVDPAGGARRGTR
jgi:hypothetical protein